MEDPGSSGAQATSSVGEAAAIPVSAPPTPPDRATIVTAAQERLAELGYDVGPATGTENPRTRVAVGRYQADEGLPLSGDLSDQTLARLGVDGATTEQTVAIDGVRLDRPLGVATVQAALNALGYDAGTPDGIMGPSTRAAIRAFQEARGLEPTGRLGADLTRALRNAAREQG